ncbi:MAG: putative NADH-quinone oxidoreductase chain J [Anaerolineales bacterium]|nr:putative NADH-quinone oxidoreductase chain J [Anaerolineales bacterium]MBM2849054.1 putative NADH-quinone oxidoreductase chain [Anaerolineales bacterium]
MTSLQIIFLIAAAATLISGLMVVTARNLVHAALWLIVALFSVAILFVLLEAGFLAAVQVVLYIGAIAILIIFAIMLTRRVMQDTGPQTNQQWWVGAIIAVALFAALFVVLRQVTYPEVTTAIPPDSLKALGNSFVDPNQYMLPFELASVLLLAAMIGAIAVAGDKK